MRYLDGPRVAVVDLGFGFHRAPNPPKSTMVQCCLQFSHTEAVYTSPVHTCRPRWQASHFARSAVWSLATLHASASRSRMAVRYACGGSPPCGAPCGPARPLTRKTGAEGGRPPAVLTPAQQQARRSLWRRRARARPWPTEFETEEPASGPFRQRILARQGQPDCVTCLRIPRPLHRPAHHCFAAQ